MGNTEERNQSLSTGGTEYVQTRLTLQLVLVRIIYVWILRCWNPSREGRHGKRPNSGSLLLSPQKCVRYFSSNDGHGRCLPPRRPRPRWRGCCCGSVPAAHRMSTLYCAHVHCFLPPRSRRNANTCLSLNHYVCFFFSSQLVPSRKLLSIEINTFSLNTPLIPALTCMDMYVLVTYFFQVPLSLKKKIPFG